MTSHTDLLETWLRLPSVPLDTLQRLGIPYRAGQIVGGLRIGRNGLLIPCFADPPSLWNITDEPLLYAIVAMDLARPDRWNIVAGDDQVGMLGEFMLQEALWHSTPLPVFRNPLTWVRSGGAGVCPLDWKRFAREILWHPEVELVTEDIETGDKAKRAIDRAARMRKPRISVEMKEAA